MDYLIKQAEKEKSTLRFFRFTGRRLIIFIFIEMMNFIQYYSPSSFFTLLGSSSP